MRITVKSGTTVVVLGDDALKQAISQFSLGSNLMVDEQALLRASGRRYQGRNNLATRLSWVVNRSHGTLGAGLKFVMDHVRTCPRDNLLVEISQFGSEAFSCWIRQAVLSDIEELDVNASSLIRYQLLGGEVLGTNPGS